jgi:2-(1,2-epoxy-1,2-dihydrophenyl)acetyl-CoA isomerase
LTYETLLIDRTERILTITLNRPQALNAVTSRMTAELVDALSCCANDSESRVLILTGAGRAFCAGEDVKERPADSAEVRSRSTPLGKLASGPRGHVHFAATMRSMTMPTIAAINGAAVGQGLSLALACDIRIASRDARLGAIWVRRGIPPESAGAYLLAQLVGPARACELIFTGRMLEAEEAKEMGLLNHVSPPGKALDDAREMALTISENAPVAIGVAKMMTYQALETSLQVHGRMDFLGQEFCFNTSDREEGIRSFIEKRPAEFTGR